MSKLTTGVEEITPAIAVKWLEANTHNRKLKERLVSVYAEAITRGEWEVNGEAIKFDVNDVLLDGQHRLWAIIEANTPIKTMVVRGLPPEVMDTLDTGKARTAADVLSIEGMANTVVLSAAARLLYGYDDGRWGAGTTKLSDDVSNRMVLETVANHPRLSDAVRLVESKRRALSTFVPSSLAAALYYILQRANLTLADDFYNAFAEGANLDERHPILQLRNSLLKRGKNNRADQVYKAALIIKAWNLFIRGKSCQRIDWRSTMEEFPLVDSPARVKRAVR